MAGKLFSVIQGEYPILFAKLFNVFVFGSVVFVFKLTECLVCKCFRFTHVGNEIRKCSFIYCLNFGYDRVKVPLLIAVIILRTVFVDKAFCIACIQIITRNGFAVFIRIAIDEISIPSTQEVNKSSRVTAQSYYVKVKMSLSCTTLCNPMDRSPPGSSVYGILQARKLEWVAIPFSRSS